MSDNYVVCEGYAYWEKDGNYFTTSVNADKSIAWKDAVKLDIKSSGGIDVQSVHQLYDHLHGIKTVQRKLLNETRKVAV